MKLFALLLYKFLLLNPQEIYYSYRICGHQGLAEGMEEEFHDSMRYGTEQQKPREIADLKNRHSLEIVSIFRGNLDVSQGMAEKGGIQVNLE